MSQNDSSGHSAQTRGLVRFHLLDPRPRDAAVERPIRGGVCIPGPEVLGRSHELPPKSQAIRIADVVPYSAEAFEAVARLGRESELISDWSFGNNAIRGRLWEPNEFLAEVTTELRAASALDLGCGSGRDCVALAAEGWSVVGVDHLPDAIERAENLGGTYLDEQDLKRVRFEVLDAKAACASGRFDLVSMLYFFDRDCVAHALDALVSGGSIVIEAFTPEHQSVHGRPSGESRVVKASELAELATGCEIRIADQGPRLNGRHTARLWATKR